MANHGETSSPEIHCIFVETNLDTCFALTVHKDETIFDFKDKLHKQHKQVFPEIGEINITALKVKLRGKFYLLSESMSVMSVYKAFDGFRKNCFMYVDAVKVEKGGEVLTIIAADDKRSNLELVKKKEFAIGSILEDKHIKDLILEEGLETKVVDKQARKRKIKSSDGKTSRKKSKVDLNQSVIDTTELCGKLPGEFASQSCEVSPREKLDDILVRADSDNGKKNGVSTRENQQTLEAYKLLDENIVTFNPDLVDGHNMDVVKDVPDNQTVKEALEKQDDLTGSIEQDLEKDGKTNGVVMIDQEKDLPPPSKFVDGQITSHDAERDEGSTLAPSVVNNLQTAELVTYEENQLEASSGLTTSPAKEKKRKWTKSSKEHINQSPAPFTTTSRKIVNEINDVPGNVDCVDAPSKSCPSLEIGTLRNLLLEAIQKETEMGMKSIDDVGRANIETDNLASHPEDYIEANSGLTTSPVTEKKKKKRKKSSKDQINQSATATTATASREIVNKISGVSENVDRADATSEFFTASRRGNLGIENEMSEKITEDVGSRKAIPSFADNIHTDNLVSYPENQLVVSSDLTTGLATGKKKKQKKSSKDHINKSTAATTTSKKIVNEGENVSGGIDCNDATSDTLVETIQNENEMGDKIVYKVGSREATLIDADKLQDANNLQVASLTSTPTALVHEPKILDQTGKFMDGNTPCERDVSKENVEIDADEAKLGKSTKKKSSKKIKTQANENILVHSGSQNVEPIKVVDGDGPENVIRNVLDSLQQREEVEENLDKSGKKSSKSSKKKISLNIVEEDQVVNTLQQKNKAAGENLEKYVKKSSKRSEKKDPLNIVEEAQILSVEENSASQREASKDTDAPFIPAKKNTESNASHLKNIIKVTDNTDDINRSMQIIKENADMGDNFGSSQKDNIVGSDKQDQVTVGAKPKKEKKSLDLHHGGSIDGSIKAKERKGRVEPSSSGTSQLQSKAMNDYSGTKVDQSDASAKGAVINKKEALKKNSNSATVKKSKMNDNNKKEAVKKNSNSVIVNKTKTNFFKDAEKWNWGEETISHVSTKTPSDRLSEDDSDVTSMSRKQGNNLVGGTNRRLLGSLQEILRSSKSYKAAKLTASHEFDDESPGLDVVPDSQGI